MKLWAQLCQGSCAGLMQLTSSSFGRLLSRSNPCQYAYTAEVDTSAAMICSPLTGLLDSPAGPTRLLLRPQLSRHELLVNQNSCCTGVLNNGGRLQHC